MTIKVTIRENESGTWGEISFGHLAAVHPTRAAAVKIVRAKLAKHARTSFEPGEITIRDFRGNVETISIPVPAGL